MEKNMYLKLLDIMLSGKNIRLRKTFREYFKSKFTLYDTWFRIVSINIDGSVNISGNYQTTINNLSIENIVLPK